ncbi:MAG: CHASE2 domain-containing protein, partial [Verrucomicrobiota bacterium]|nr:CHASE2 domain-containing protein [Verrucomicrobiota bacterium]
MKRALIIGCVAVVCFLALTLLELYQPFTYLRARNLYQDALTRAGATTPPNPDLVFLAIDSDSVGLEETADIKELYGLTDSNAEEARALRLMSKLWPWPREVYGLVLERLARAGARVVIFDLTFPTSTEGDEPFRLALDRYKDRVVIGSNFVSASSRGFSTIGASHTRPPETLVPQTTPIDDRVAYTNFWPDEDDVVRRAQYRVTFEEVQGNKSFPESEQFLSLAARGLTKAGLGDSIPPGLGSRLFRFTAPPRQGFSPHSIFEIFVPEYWKHNYQNGEFFRGKTILIGAEGNWQHDEHPTPFGAMPGPEIHLNAINAALHGSFIRELSPAVVAVLTALAGLIAIALTLLVRSPWLRIVGAIALNGAGAALALFAFNRASILLP